MLRLWASSLVGIIRWIYEIILCFVHWIIQFWTSFLFLPLGYSDIFFTAVQCLIYTSFIMILWWMLKSVVTFVDRPNNKLPDGRFFLLLLFIQPGRIAYYIRCIWRAFFTVCHIVHLYSLLKMMAEIKHNPRGKEQMANNCIWPLSENVHWQHHILQHLS